MYLEGDLSSAQNLSGILIKPEPLSGNLSKVKTLSGSLTNDVLRGYSAYELAVQHGFEGSYDDWAESLKGNQIELQMNGLMLQWRYVSKLGEEEDEWKDLADLTSDKDYHKLVNKPFINEIEVDGKLTLDELGIQPLGDYVELRSVKVLTNKEIEDKFKF